LAISPTLRVENARAVEHHIAGRIGVHDVAGGVD
jgi:hypothetical protein